MKVRLYEKSDDDWWLVGTSTVDSSNGRAARAPLRHHKESIMRVFHSGLVRLVHGFLFRQINKLINWDKPAADKLTN